MRSIAARVDLYLYQVSIGDSPATYRAVTTEFLSAHESPPCSKYRTIHQREGRVDNPLHGSNCSHSTRIWPRVCSLLRSRPILIHIQLSFQHLPRCVEPPSPHFTFIHFLTGLMSHLDAHLS